MELVPLKDLALLADLLGPDSLAAKALAYARSLDDPTVYRHGRKLLIFEGQRDPTAETAVFRRPPGLGSR